MKRLAPLLALALAPGFMGCDDDDESATVASVTELPAAAVTSTGDGPLVLHPSADPAWGWALSAPVRIAEHVGGSADWNWARLSVFQAGIEVERAEIGADVLNAAGIARVEPLSSRTHALVFRLNSNAFDFLILELQFTDLKDGREFPSGVPFETFSGVGVSPDPLSVPQSDVARLDTGR